jgi:hypothetical protein
VQDVIGVNTSSSHLFVRIRIYDLSLVLSLLILYSPFSSLLLHFYFSSPLLQPHPQPRSTYRTPALTLILTLSRSTESLLMFSGGAEGFVVMLGGHVKCRTHMGWVSTAVEVVLASLRAIWILKSIESRRSPTAVQPCSSATSCGVRSLLSLIEGSAPPRESSFQAAGAPTHGRGEGRRGEKGKEERRITTRRGA